MRLHLDHIDTVSIEDDGGMVPLVHMQAMVARGTMPEMDRPRDATIDATVHATIILAP